MKKSVVILRGLVVCLLGDLVGHVRCCFAAQAQCFVRVDSVAVAAVRFALQGSLF